MLRNDRARALMFAAGPLAGRNSGGVGVVVVAVRIRFRRLQAPRPDQPDRPLKRFQRDLRAAAAHGEAEPLSLPRLAQRDRELRLELAAEGADGHGGAGGLAHRERDVAVVAGEGVAPAVPD